MDTVYQDNPCMFPGCKYGAITRGLCQKHRRQAKKLCVEGKTTEAELIEKGLMAPVKTNSTLRNYKR